MDGKSPTTARPPAHLEPAPILSFIETGDPEPRPRLLVDRLLYARALLQASAVLAPRFVLGDCAAAHHIVLGGAGASVLAVDLLRSHGFRVERSIDPPGIRFFLTSSHAESEIRSLLVAIILVVRELSTIDDLRRRSPTSAAVR